MLRILFCAVQMLLAVAFTMPGCAKNGNSLRAPVPVDDPGGLRVGTAAPEIAGEDMEGTSFKLSDYRGKVVLLDFWGNW
jgi:cytochrome oxidase Cu insertion factor (SCO1/SenC/PrrC family)